MEEGAELIERAADAFLRGVVGGAQRNANLAEALVLKIAKEDRVPIDGVERLHGLVEQRLDRGPRIGGWVHGGVLGQECGGRFARLSARFAAHGVDGGPPTHDVQPRDERGGGLERAGVAGEIDEDRLRHILGELRRTGDAACDRVGEVEVALDERGEGGLGIFLGVAAQEIVVTGRHSDLLSPPGAESDTNPERKFPQPARGSTKINTATMWQALPPSANAWRITWW